MKSAEYRSIIGLLPIKNPTPDVMALLCPHLTKEEAVEAFTVGKGYVACPSLRVHHSFQVINYSKEYVFGRKNQPARLNYSFAQRTLESYADGKLHGDVISLNYPFIERAMKFSEDNWGEELILDNWIDVVNINVQDPTDLVNDCSLRNYPRTKAVIQVALNRRFNDIINDHSKPESELLDEAIVHIADDSIIQHEIKGGRGGYTEYNCAHCGAGLSLTKCTGCGHSYSDDFFRCGWDTPLPAKVVAFLHELGHGFAIDPEIARVKERKFWENYSQKRASQK